jgi:hypothetical protein
MASCSVNCGASPADTTAAAPTKRSRAALWLLAVLLLGAVFRVVWGDTMEYKQDEAWLYGLVTAHCTRGEWADLGMPSSQHLRVPGLSVWVFYPFGRLFGVEEPTALARGVQLCSFAALVLLVLFAWRCVPAGEREPWLWAAALIAVNPTAVLYHRKLWPPCMLPLFCVLFLAAWWYRDRRWGALAWGVVGALLGQIHASGFLYAFAVLLATVIADRRRVRWGSWLAGSAIGTLPMAGWLLYLLRDHDPMGDNAWALHRWLEGKFWGHWVTEPIGLDLSGFFGQDYADFLRWPLLAGQPTYGAAILQGLAALVGGAIMVVAVCTWWQRRRRPGTAPAAWSSSALLVWTGCLGYGLLLTLASVRFYRHYLLVTFPLMALWLARLALPELAGGRVLAWGRRLLVGLCVVNALSCALTLSYLHTHGGAPNGGFGLSYEGKVREGGQRPPSIPLPDEALADRVLSH